MLCSLTTCVLSARLKLAQLKAQTVNTLSSDDENLFAKMQQATMCAHAVCVCVCVCVCVSE